MKTFRSILAFLLLTILLNPCFSQVTLPRLISDGMVFQRDRKITVWGWASPGEKVTVRFNGKQGKANTASNGVWSLDLPAMNAGGPFTMTVSGKNEITVADILIGDVWLCAGQSNMVHQMNIHDVTYADDISNANYPQIRHFKIPTTTDLAGPSKDLTGGEWQRAIGDEVRPFSAVAYFFARKLYEKYRVPIGLINASVGGTPIEAWISKEGFQQFPDVWKTIEQNQDTAYVNSMTRNRSGNQPAKSQDKGLSGSKPWYATDYKPKDWRTINIPGYWEDQGIRDLNGVVWYRREIDIPESMSGKQARLFLGRVVDADKVYINGKEVGNTGYQYPQRRYVVPAGVLTAGKNIFVIRVVNFGGKGGFVPDKPYYLFAGSDTVDLQGNWQYKVGEVFVPQPASTSFSAQNQPTSLYNGMVAPYVKTSLKGVLWYQGEANTWKPEQYEPLLKALIADWRQKFSNAGLPFIYAQLPNFMEVNYLPSESSWAVLRESQMKVLSVPNTAMTVNIDLGEWNDIHPDNKKDVGERMALAALKLAYGENVIHAGPLYESHAIEGNKIIITFTHTGGGLITDDGEDPAEFAIAGADKKFAWAKAKIDGNKVIVWSEDIPDPKYVRYAWADNPDNPNLYNKERLPASPFRTDR